LETQLNTREFAKKLGKQPSTLHAAVCRQGSYYGIRPQKLPDGTLLWPDDAVEQLVEYAKLNGACDKAKKARDALAAKRAGASS
jgi:hypothetical protein